MEPLVSILIPCFNAEPWIAQSIESALDQNYRNKEVIVVDDGSTDGSAAIISKFGTAVRFEALPHRGGNAARNRLTQLARGEWVQYLDADDYLLPGKISDQMEFTGNFDGSPDVIYSPVIIHDVQQPAADYVLRIEGQDETIAFIRWTALNTGGLLLRRQVVVDAGGWKEDQPCCQEHELLLRLIMAERVFRLCDRAGAVYRQHGSHTVSRRDPLRVMRVRMELTDCLADWLASRGAMTPGHRKALYAARLECARSAWPSDRPLAEELAARAAEIGPVWVRKSAALPARYQIALRFFGFRQAEGFAARTRKRRLVHG